MGYSPSLPDITTGNRERRHRMQAMENYRESVYDEERTCTALFNPNEDSYKNNKNYNLFWNNGDGLDLPIVQDSLNKFYNNSTNLFDYYFRTGKVTMPISKYREVLTRSLITSGWDIIRNWQCYETRI